MFILKQVAVQFYNDFLENKFHFGIYKKSSKNDDDEHDEAGKIPNSRPVRPTASEHNTCSTFSRPDSRTTIIYTGELLVATNKAYVWEYIISILKYFYPRTLFASPSCVLHWPNCWNNRTPSCPRPPEESTHGDVPMTEPCDVNSTVVVVFVLGQRESAGTSAGRGKGFKNL